MHPNVQAARDRESLGDITALPEWVRELITEKTPYLAADPDLWVSIIGENRCQVFARRFFYGIDRQRQQIV